MPGLAERETAIRSPWSIRVHKGGPRWTAAANPRPGSYLPRPWCSCRMALCGIGARGLARHRVVRQKTKAPLSACRAAASVISRFRILRLSLRSAPGARCARCRSRVGPLHGLSALSAPACLLGPALRRACGLVLSPFTAIALAIPTARGHRLSPQLAQKKSSARTHRPSRYASAAHQCPWAAPTPPLARLTSPKHTPAHRQPSPRG